MKNRGGIRGMGHVFQPKYVNKRTGEEKRVSTWFIKYYVHGKPHTETSGSTNRNVAERLLKQRHGDAQAGKAVGAQVERTTLDDLLAMVQADYAANGRKSGRRLAIAAGHLREFFDGTTKAREITSDRITAFVAHRRSEGAAPASINVEQAYLRRGFRLAAKAGKVSGRPEMSMLHLNNARQGFFERDQYEAVLRHLPAHVKGLVQVAYLTGWRRSELLSRQWRHVDLKLGWLRLEPGETKNGKGRSFPFHNYPELREVIEKQREHVTAIERATDTIIPWLFINPNGGQLMNFRGPWRSACRAAGCPGRLLHDFRRTRIRDFERKGISRSAGMALSGHLTASIYSRYSIVDSKTLEEATEKLASQMSSENSQSTVKVSPFPVKKR